MTKFTRLNLNVLAAGFVAVAAQPAVAGGNIELGYVVEVAGATVMKAAYSATIAETTFESTLSGKTSGVSNMFSGYKMHWLATGLHDSGRFSPQSYENTRKKKSKKAKSTGIVWQAQGVTLTTGEALPADVAASLAAPSTDPLTAILKIAAAQSKKPCSGKHRIYDGKDVYDLSLAFKKKITLANASGAPGLDCTLTSTPIAGRAVDSGETKPDVYGFTLAPTTIDGRIFYIPVRITGSSKGLSVTVSASSIVVDGAEINVGI